jgi:hypothetical protein
MGRRNWCCITLKQPSGDLLFDIRVEKEKGQGETVGYAISLPHLGYVRFIVPLQVFYSGTSATMDSQGRQMSLLSVEVVQVNTLCIFDCFSILTALRMTLCHSFASHGCIVLYYIVLPASGDYTKTSLVSIPLSTNPPPPRTASARLPCHLSPCCVWCFDGGSQ